MLWAFSFKTGIEGGPSSLPSIGDETARMEADCRSFSTPQSTPTSTVNTALQPMLSWSSPLLLTPLSCWMTTCSKSAKMKDDRSSSIAETGLIPFLLHLFAVFTSSRT